MSESFMLQALKAELRRRQEEADDLQVELAEFQERQRVHGALMVAAIQVACLKGQLDTLRKQNPTVSPITPETPEAESNGPTAPK